MSSLDVDGEIGQALRSVGLFAEDTEVSIFPDLNVALEHCENKLLTALYRQQEQRRPKRIGLQPMCPEVGLKSRPRHTRQSIWAAPEAESSPSSGAEHIGRG